MNGVGSISGALGEDRVDNEQPAVRSHRVPACGEDARRVVVVPVVQHPGHEVGVGAGRPLVEEVASNALHAIVDPDLAEVGESCRERGVEVEQDAAQCGRGLQDRREQHAASASHVDQRAVLPEVVRGDHIRGLLLAASRHRSLEERLLLGVVREVLEEPMPVIAVERNTAIRDRLEQAAGRGVIHLAAHDGRRLEGDQLMAERGELEATVVPLVDHVFEREPPQHAMQQRGVDTDCVRELVGRLRPFGEQRCDPELRRERR